MTAGMTTQNLENSRVSLPRAGLGALLAATLLAGGLIGAAAYAGIGAAIAQPATVSATLQHESIVVRDLRIAAGRGQLVGETNATLVIGGTGTRTSRRTTGSGMTELRARLRSKSGTHRVAARSGSGSGGSSRIHRRGGPPGLPRPCVWSIRWAGSHRVSPCRRSAARGRTSVPRSAIRGRLRSAIPR